MPIPHASGPLKRLLVRVSIRSFQNCTPQWTLRSYSAYMSALQVGSPTPGPLLRVEAVTIAAESDKGTKHLTSGKLRVSTRKYELLCGEHGTLRQDFPDPLILSSEVQASLHFKESRFSLKKTRKLDIQHLFASAQGSRSPDLSLVQDGIRVTFSCQAAESIHCVPPAPASIDPDSSMETLVPTTQTILDGCPRFRILVIGKSGVGKSSLINTAFGIKEARAEDSKPGKAMVDTGLTSPENKRFILHDSEGFEPGEKGKYDTVKNFIESRRTAGPEDQLHAIWFCIPTPREGDRLLEAAAEDFFLSKQRTIGTIPLIVVFTKFDECVDELTLNSSSPATKDQITQEALLEAQRGHDKIAKIAGGTEPLPYAVVSANPEYRYTLAKLIELTNQEVGISNTPEVQVVSQMAQRIDPGHKIRGSITVGKKRYWNALWSSPDFKGYTIWDCLSVVHSDIVAVWNFNDPAYRLLDKEFKELIVNLVLEMEPSGVTDPNRVFASLGKFLKPSISSSTPAVQNPLTPVMFPVAVGATAVAGIAAATVWIHAVYQHGKTVRQRFMAFIVDLTHVMKTLFILTVPHHHKLTRRAIKLAYSIYHESVVKANVHARIQMCDADGKGAALEMIESLIIPEGSGNQYVEDYYADVHNCVMEAQNLDQEEDW